MIITLSRREVIAGLGGSAAATWPLTARAQQPNIPVIGFLGATDYDYRVAAFHRGLKERGYIEGQNVKVEYRWAQGQYDRLPAMAAELVRRNVTVIVAGGNTSAGLAARKATEAIPVVFSLEVDPIAYGLVTGLSRPGGNVTGVTFLVANLSGKRAEILHELIPGAVEIGYLLNPKSPSAELQANEVELAAATLGLKLATANASTEAEIERAFAMLSQRRVPAILFSADGYFHCCPNVARRRRDKHLTIKGYFIFGPGLDFNSNRCICVAPMPPIAGPADEPRQTRFRSDHGAPAAVDL